ncbi:MAG: ESPR-type extended signal peptide-containing protein [Pasteurellaceae bacterium]|nr:ESPR-type extended signal peptide-containing protein [Pasteurellaceae bacterium]
MNRVFRVLWNASTQSWVAVSELARGRVKSSSNQILTASQMALLVLGLVVSEDSESARSIQQAGVGNVYVETSGGAANSNILIGQNATNGAARLTAMFGEKYAFGSNILVKESEDQRGRNNIVVGNGTASGNSGVILGHGARTWGLSGGAIDQIAIGTDAVSAGQKTVAIGAYSGAGAEGATSIGPDSFAVRSGSIALGSGAIAVQVNSTAIGIGAKSSRANAVALGSGATTDKEATKEGAISVSGIVYDSSTGEVADTSMQVSFGKVGSERQLKHVAPGKISANSTDAINGSQLYSITKGLQSRPITFQADSNSVTRNLGQTLQIVGGGGGSGSFSAKNVKTVATSNQGKIQIQFSDTPNFTSLTTTGNAQVGGTFTATGLINANGGLTVAGNKSVNMGNNRIQGVQAGTGNTDAVNVSQLDAVRTNTVKLESNNGNTSTQQLNHSGGLSFGVKGEGTYISSSASDSTVTFDLTQNTKNKINNAADKSLSNLDTAGANKIKEHAKNAVAMVDGANTKATTTTGTNGVKTFKVDVDLSDYVRTTDLANAAQLSYKANSEQAKQVALTTGLSFQNTGNLTISTAADGVVNIGLDDATKNAIKKQTEVEGGNGVSVSEKNTPNTSGGKTFTVSLDNAHIKQQAKEAVDVTGDADIQVTPQDASNQKTFAVSLNKTNAVTQGEQKVVTSGAVYQAIANSGWTVKVNNDQSSKHISNNASLLFHAGENIRLALDQNASKITIQTVESPTFTGLTTTGTASLAGLTITGGQVNMGNKVVQGVQNGVNTTDAANIGQLNEVRNNHVKLNADQTSTRQKQLNTTGGLSFGIKGQTDYIETSASGDDVTIRLTQTAKNKLDNAADKDLSNLNTTGVDKLKEHARSAVEMIDGTNTKATTTENNGVKTFQVDVDLTKATLAYNTEGGQAKSTPLATGLTFKNAGNLTITAEENGVVSLGLDQATKADIAKQASVVSASPTDLTISEDTNQSGGKAYSLTLNKATAVTDNDEKVVTSKAVHQAIANSGWTVQVNDAQTSKHINNNATLLFKEGKNISLAWDATNSKITIQTIESPTFTSLTTNQAATIGGMLNANGGLMVAGSQTVNLGNNVVQGVQNGVNATDAANIRQLDALRNNHLKFTGDSGNTDTQSLNTTGGLSFGIKGQTDYIETSASGSDVSIRLSQAAKAKLDNAADQSLSNLTEAGQKVLNDAAKGAVNVTGNHDITVSTSDVDKVKTFALSLEKATQVAETDEKAVTSKAVYQAIQDSGWYLKVNDKDARHISNNGTVAFQQDSNIEISLDDQTNKLTIKTVDSPTFTGLTTTAEATIGGMLNANGGLAVKSGTSVNLGNNVVSGVAAGVSDTDAANMKQLNEVRNNHVKLTGDNSTETSQQQLNATAGLSFGIKGQENYIETKAQGSDVHISLSEAAKNTLDNAADKNLSNLSDAGKSQIKAQLDIANGTNTIATATEVNGVKTFKVDVDLTKTELAYKAGDETAKKTTLSTGLTFKSTGNVTVETEEGGVIHVGLDQTTKDDIKKQATVTSANNDDISVSETQNTTGGTQFALTLNKATSVSEHDEKAVTSKAVHQAIAGSGWTVKVNEEENGKHISNNSTVTFKQGKNIEISLDSDNSKITVQTVENPIFTSLTTNQTATIGGMLNANGGLTVAENQTVNMGGNVVQGVKNGVNATDAANMEQLNELRDNLTTKGLNFAGTEGKTLRQLGETLTIVGNATATGDYSSHNVKTVVTDGKVEVQFADSPFFKTVTADALTVNTTATVGGMLTAQGGFTVAENQTVNLGNNVVSGVADGEADTDATNVKQLNELSQNLTNKGLSFTGNDGNTARKLGETLTIVGNATATGDYSSHNVKTVVTDGKVEVQFADSPFFKTVTADALTVNTTATVGGMLTAQGGFTVAENQTVNLGNNVVSGVADARTDTDATNFKQVKSLLANSAWRLNTGVIEDGIDETESDLVEEQINPNDQLRLQAGKNLKIKREANGIVTYSTKDDVSFNRLNVTGQTQLNQLAVSGQSTLNQLTVNGVARFNQGFSVAPDQTLNMGGNRLQNVGDAKQAGDAVNLKQLQALSDALTKAGISFNGNEGETLRQLGELLSIKGDATTPGNYHGGNIKTVVADGEVKIQFAENPTFANVQAESVAAARVTVSDELVASGDTTLGGEGRTLHVVENTHIDMGGNVIRNIGSGSIAAGSQDAVNGGDVHTAIHEASQHLTNAGLVFTGNNTDTKVNRKLGEELRIIGGGTQADDQYSSHNVKTTGSQGGEIEIKIAKNPTFADITANRLESQSANIDSATFGDATVGGKDKSFTVAEHTRVNMGGNIMSNIGSGKIGAGSQDAVNGGDVHRAISEVTTSLTEGGLKFIGNNGETITTRLGESLSIVGNGDISSSDFSADNIRTVTQGDKLVIEMATNPAFENVNTKQLNAGKTTLTEQGLVLGDANGTKFTQNGIHAGNQVISGVANGDISATSNQAVNGAQLYAIQQLVGNTSKQTSTVDVVNNEGSTTTVVVPTSNNYTLTTYNVENQKEYRTNNVIEAIGRMNEQGIKFFHTNDGEVKPAVQGENTIDSSASGRFATAVGYQAIAQGENAIALGKGAKAEGENTISLGHGNIVTGNNSGAIGDPSTVSGNYSYSVGNDNQIKTDNTFVFGNNVSNTADNSVFLGANTGYVAQGKMTQGNAAYTSQKIGENHFQYAGGKAEEVVGVVSIGNVDSDGAMQNRRIQHVAPGLVSQESTDAINGSQLYALTAFVNQGWQLETGTVAGSNGLAETAEPAKVGLGNSVKINAGNNIVLTQTGNVIDIAAINTPVFESLQINKGGSVDMGGNRIQNVGIAINPTDALNYGQFKSELGKVDSRLRSGIAGAVASASLVQAFNPSESILAIGGGTYRGASAVSVGYSRVSDNGKMILKFTGSANNYGDITGGASIGFKF